MKKSPTTTSNKASSSGAVFIMEPFLVIDKTLIVSGFGGHYVAFISDLDICNDGSGPSHGDSSYQSMTAYNPYLNADKDKYIVTPPQVRVGVPPAVLGCLGRVTNLKTSVSSWGVVGDVGPDDIVGECAYCLAKVLNPKISHNTGDDARIYLYEFWPGIAAKVDGKQYKLQPA